MMAVIITIILALIKVLLIIYSYMGVVGAICCDKYLWSLELCCSVIQGGRLSLSLTPYSNENL